MAASGLLAYTSISPYVWHCLPALLLIFIPPNHHGGTLTHVGTHDRHFVGPAQPVGSHIKGSTIMNQIIGQNESWTYSFLKSYLRVKSHRSVPEHSVSTSSMDDVQRTSMHIVKTSTAYLHRLVYCWPPIGWDCCWVSSRSGAQPAHSLPQSRSASQCSWVPLVSAFNSYCKHDKFDRVKLYLWGGCQWAKLIPKLFLWLQAEWSWTPWPTFVCQSWSCSLIMIPEFQ